MLFWFWFFHFSVRLLLLLLPFALPEFHLPGFHSIKLNGIREGITSLFSPSLHRSPFFPSRALCERVHRSAQKSMAADCWWSTMVKQLTINERVTSGTYTIHAKSILLTNWILCSLPFSIYTIHILLCKHTAKTISGCRRGEEKKPTFTEKNNVDWDFRKERKKRVVCVCTLYNMCAKIPK